MIRFYSTSYHVPLCIKNYLFMGKSEDCTINYDVKCSSVVFKPRFARKSLATSSEILMFCPPMPVLPHSVRGYIAPYTNKGLILPLWADTVKIAPFSIATSWEPFSCFTNRHKMNQDIPFFVDFQIVRKNFQAQGKFPWMTFLIHQLAVLDFKKHSI